MALYHREKEHYHKEAIVGRYQYVKEASYIYRDGIIHHLDK
jgi:hypothetical protein